METITLTKEGLQRIINRTSGMGLWYKQQIIDDLFEAQKEISEGRYEKKRDDDID